MLPATAAMSPRTLLVSRVIQGGIDNQTPPNLLRNDFAGLPRNAQAVLFDRIGHRVEEEIDPRLVEGLATALQGSQQEASAVIDLWRTYRLGRVTPMLSEENWNNGRVALMEKLGDKLGMTVHSSRQIPFLLAGAPSLVIETFHNVVMGTGRDLPRLSKAALERELFPEDAATHVQLVRAWEVFWEEIALSKNWGIKPAVVGDPQIILSGMAYAQAAGWDLNLFRGWLFRTLKGKPEFAHVLTMFDAVIDTSVLYRKSEKPRLRPTIPQLLKKAQLTPAYQRKFTDWGKKWEALAEKLGGAHAVRPRKLNALRLSERRAAGKSRESIFVSAATDGNNVQRLYRDLLNAGLASDAAAVANILVGLNDNPRKSTGALAVPNYHPDSLLAAEKRVEALAIQYGFLLKSKISASNNRGKSRYLGDRFRHIAAEAPPGVLPLAYLEAILSDPEIGKIWEEKRMKAFATLFRLWNEWQKSNPHPSKLGLQRRIAEEHGLPVSSMHTWWRRFDSWGRRFGW